MGVLATAACAARHLPLPAVSPFLHEYTHLINLPLPTLSPKFTKQLAADRQSVTCGACELASRPRTAPPAPAPTVELVTAEVDASAPGAAPASG